MKRYLWLQVTLVLLILMLVGCSTESHENAIVSNNQNEASETNEKQQNPEGFMYEDQQVVMFIHGQSLISSSLDNSKR